jgi:hypothetical protein
VERTVISEQDADRANIRLGEDEEIPAHVQALAQVKADDYGGRLVKYIPPEVIGAFTAIEGVVQGGFKPKNVGGVMVTDPVAQTCAWVVFGIMLIATPLYLSRVAKVTKVTQIAISTIAFGVWAFAYPGPPFGTLGINQTLSSIALMLYVFLIPIVEV